MTAATAIALVVLAAVGVPALSIGAAHSPPILRSRHVASPDEAPLGGSLMQKTSLSAIDRYLEAMNDPTLYATSDFPFTAEVQRAIYKHQHPPSCSNARFLIFHVWSHGFGSFSRGMSTALSMAIASNRVLLLAAGTAPPYKRKTGAKEVWTGWNHAAGCKKEHPECFFKPISGCSLDKVHDLMVRGKLSYEELNDDSTYEHLLSPEMSSARVVVARTKLQWLGTFRKNIPIPGILDVLRVSPAVKQNEYFDTSNPYAQRRIWSIQTMVYLLRLNKRMQLKVHEGLKKCFNSENPPLHRIIGLPIRGTDKCYRYVDGKKHGEAKCVSLADTMRIAEQIHIAQPWVDTVLVTSEDPSVLKSASRMGSLVLGSDPTKRWRVLTNEDDVQQGTGSSSSTGIKPHGGDLISSANITESIITTLACQVLPSHHIVLMRSSKLLHSVLATQIVRSSVPSVRLLTGEAQSSDFLLFYAPCVFSKPRVDFGDIIDMLSKAVPGRRSYTTLNSGLATYPS